MKPSHYNRKLSNKLQLLILLTGIQLSTFSQTNSPDSSFQKQFNNFNTSIKQDFNTFRQHNDSLFLKFLSGSWKEFDAVQNKIPSPPKPVEPPTYKAPVIPVVPRSDSILHQTPDSIRTQPILEPRSGIMDKEQNPQKIELPDENQPLPVKTEIIPEQAAISNALPMTKIAYYGTDFNIPSNIRGLPVVAALTKQGVAQYFASASASSVLNSAALTVKKEADECRLNDWGMANLMMQAAKKMYPRQIDQVLFTWFALLRNGYNVKVGYDQQNAYLLLPSNELLYELSYTVNGREYYLLNFSSEQLQPERLSIHEADYPQGITGLSFLITQTPELSNLFTPRTLKLSPALELKLNKNLIDFYKSYPQCELKVFFKAPVSASTISQLDAYFLPSLTNKNDDEKVAFLLEFVHKAIPYKTDGQQFGHEKYLFADETLYYPAADCEDRAVLLAKLINRYTKCKAIGLSYPTHVSVAVNLSALPNGKFITYKNLKYFHCDPTYIGAACGMLMSEFENVTPIIIDFNQ